jgi:hypothetical protein
MAIVAIFAVARWFRGSGRLPAGKSFRCSRCGVVEVYTNRTLEAWRAGKSKLFCKSCHSKWLQSQSRKPATTRPSGAGCLGAVLLVAFLPGLAIWVFYFAYRVG